MKNYEVTVKIEPVSLTAESAEEALAKVEERLIDAGFKINDSYVDEDYEYEEE